MERDDERQREPDEQEGEARVELCHVPQGDGYALGHLLAGGVAGMRAGPGGGGPRRQHDREKAEHPPREPQDGRRHEEVPRSRAVVP
ncbi:MAG TPA: hypothetical protein VMB82_08020 [Acidimicrobiales bacterium]|nr:hypothetical protein [Acidimicrobiales bacterium]